MTRTAGGLLISSLCLVLGCGPGSVSDAESGDAPSTDTDPGESQGASETGTDSQSGGESETGDDSLSTNSDPSDSDDFFPETDVSPMIDCDMFMQDCPEGEKCVPYMDGDWDTKCVPVLGDAGPGEPCTSDGVVEATDNCGADSMCWGLGAQDMSGECVAFCGGNPEEPVCPPESECLICSDFCPPVCIPQCNPLLQDCNEGQGCYWATNDFQCVVTAEEGIPVGEPCGFINDCAAGLNCTPAEFVPGCAESSCCAPFCDLDVVEPQCEALPETSCLPFFEPPAPAGYENVGLCYAEG